MDFSKLAPKETVNSVMDTLAKGNMTAYLVETKEEAKNKVLSIIPEGAEVMIMSSVTLEETGIKEAVDGTGKYVSVKNKLAKLNRETDSREMQKIGSSPEWTIGSVHAVTQDGHVVIASNTGSQLPAYAYGAAHVIWVVSTKKIVKNLDEAIKRIQEYIVPQESVRLAAAYNMPGIQTNMSKLLIVNKELIPNRIHIVFVNEELGF
jgi:L-lactate utilization protein LutC